MIRKLLKFIRGEQSLKKLIDKGLKVGDNLTLMGGCIIDPSHCWHIEIGNDVILAPRVHILAHDASTKIFLQYTRVANVKVGNRVFIGAGTIILPGVTIGDDVVVGAGSVVSKNIPANSVAVGAPAKVICSLESYVARQKIKMQAANTFDKEFTLRNPQLSDAHKMKMKETCDKYGELYLE